MSLFLDDGDIRLYHGDALGTVRQLPDESVDCVVTSPPYWGLRDYGTDGQMGLEETPDLFVAGMVELFREIRRVLAPHGTCWVNLGDSYAATKTSDRHFTQPTGPDGTPATKHPPQFGGQRTAVGGLKPKDLVGAPWRVAFALQADGWWLRSDIIWAKPNPMPESVTDRPTKSHEYVFLLTKSPRYWFDTEAVREPYEPDGRKATTVQSGNGAIGLRGIGERERWANAGRNVRSVWQIATQPYPEAHFATYPEELARRCILAGCPVRVCRVCGKPSERIVERTGLPRDRGDDYRNGAPDVDPGNANHGRRGITGAMHRKFKEQNPDKHLGWTECDCDDGGLSETQSLGGIQRQDPAMPGVPSKWRPGVVLDPFIGSGTTAKVARDHQRHAIGIDLNLEYLELAARRLQQLSLLT